MLSTQAPIHREIPDSHGSLPAGAEIRSAEAARSRASHTTRPIPRYCAPTEGPCATPTPRAVWKALVSGCWTVSERFEQNGNCHLVLRRSSRGMRAARALSASEEATLRGSALGYANKYLALEFECSAATVSSTIKRAREKLGVRSRLELVQLLCCDSRAPLHADTRQVVLSYPAPPSTLLPSLSQAERDVLHSILAELSNEEIAQARGSSPRTIANQVAAIFKKLGAGSRGELVTYYSRAAWPHLERPDDAPGLARPGLTSSVESA